MTPARFWPIFIAFAALGRAASVAPPTALEGFLDGVMEAQQKAHHFAGAVVVVVSDGQVVFEKGYGYSDVAGRKPVDPRRTLFRIASNSKMFVWTAVMQLVDSAGVRGAGDAGTSHDPYRRV